MRRTKTSAALAQSRDTGPAAGAENHARSRNDFDLFRSRNDWRGKLRQVAVDPETVRSAGPTRNARRAPHAVAAKATTAATTRLNPSKRSAASGVLQQTREIGCRLWPFIRIFRKRLHEGGRDSSRQTQRWRQRRWRIVKVFADDARNGLSAKRPLAGNHLVEHRAETV